LDVARFTPQPAIPGAAQAAIAGHGEISVSKSPRPASQSAAAGSAAIRLHRPGGGQSQPATGAAWTSLKF
jgi:hypothetical protein